MSVLTEDALQGLLKANPGWQLNGGKLVRDWVFKDFVTAIAFVNRVADMAETAGHHPDIDIRYNRVRLGLVSHDAKGITKRDESMAIEISKEFPA